MLTPVALALALAALVLGARALLRIRARAAAPLFAGLAGEIAALPPRPAAGAVVRMRPAARPAAETLRLAA